MYIFRLHGNLIEDRSFEGLSFISFQRNNIPFAYTFDANIFVDIHYNRYRPFSLSLFLILSNDEFLNESKRNRIVYKMYDILINFDDRATLARSDIGGEYWTLQTGPCSTRPSGMPMVPVLIHCRVVRIYLDAGASVSDAWVGTHADACNLTGRYIFAG